MQGNFEQKSDYCAKRGPVSRGQGYRATERGRRENAGGSDQTERLLGAGETVCLEPNIRLLRSPVP
jgi:hypothetical protein